jgi:hypothetical protein
MVESLIVAPALIVIALGGSYVYGTAGAELDALYLARQSAWTQTVDGCSEIPVWDIWDFKDIVERMITRDEHLGEMASEGDFDSTAYWHDQMRILVAVLGDEDTKVGTGEGKTPEVTPSGSREADGRRAPPSSQSVREEVLMGCNETPHDLGTRRSAFEWIRELYFD